MLTDEEQQFLSSKGFLQFAKGLDEKYPLLTIKDLENKATGLYYYKLNQKPLKLYFDLSVKDQVWVRLNKKINSNFYPIEEINHFDQGCIAKLLEMAIDFGVSNNLDTIKTDQSWIIKNVQISVGKTNSNGVNYDTLAWDLKTCFYNLLNGKTPDGCNWNINYQGGYIWFNGELGTFGTWKSMYVGANWTSYAQIGTNFSIRTGGYTHHTGEFIHSSCNGYKNINNSITSRVNWNDVRVFWLRIK